MGADKANLLHNGPGVHYILTLTVAFKRGFQGTESRSQFADRVRQFLVDLGAAISKTNGTSSAGPLAVIRDPDGARFAKDRTATAEVVSNGSLVSFTVDDDMDSPPYEWNVGETVYFVDPGSSYGAEFEYATLTTVGTDDSLTVDGLTYAKQDGALVYRVESLYPEVLLNNYPRVGVSGGKSKDVVRSIDLEFLLTVDPVAGGLGE
jgi:hypothetical protein